MSQRFDLPPYAAIAAEPPIERVTAVMRRVYLWMCLGLLVTAGAAFAVVATPLASLIARTPILFYGLLVGELALVVVLSMAINRLSSGAALALFFLYAALNGLTLALIVLFYTLSSIALAFVATASLFGAMSIVGYTTKVDLTRLGGFLLMALIGLIIGSVVNLFLASSAFDAILTYAGILIFIALTAYDTQAIKRMVAAAPPDEETVGRLGVIGALRLYLDFINLFLRLLRLMGRRR